MADALKATGRGRRLVISRYGPKLLAVLVPVVAVLLAFLVGAIPIALSGVSPAQAYAALVQGAFGSINNLAETLLKTAPLLLAALGTALSYRGKIVNIGAEGQIYMGAIGAAYVGLFMGDIAPALGIPLALLAGFALGAIWCGIAAVLKLRFGASEIIVTLMLNYIAILLVKYLISSPWKDPKTTEPFTAPIAAGATLPILISGTRLHAGILIAVAAAFVLWWMLRSTVFGYQLTVAGISAKAAAYSGIKIGRVIFLTMLLSGGLAGLAGAGEVSGVQHRLLEGLSPSYGYIAIAIAMLGKSQPLGVMLAAFLFAGLLVGVDGMQQAVGVPVSVAMILEGLVLLFVLGGDMLRQRLIVAQQKKERN
jgi:general nucleoside transport system permease protein